MKSRLLNTALVLAALMFLSILAFNVRPGVTADSVAVLKTTGMTCSSCSKKITTALESRKGVATAEVDIDGGWVVVGYDTRSVKPEALAATVSENGFGCNVHLVLTPEQFRQATGRDPGSKSAAGSGCCGKSGCISDKHS
jgi:copper chaperone CopZ